MKILVLTFVDSENIYKPVLDITEPNHREYCGLNGYDYIVKTISSKITKNVLTPELSLERSKNVSEKINDYDAVLEIGSDIIFTNYNKRIEDIILPTDSLVIAKEQLNSWPINDDVLLWINTNESKELLNLIISEFPEWKKMQWIRQSWLKEFLESTNPLNKFVRVVDAKVMNSHPQPSPGQWTRGDFICHCLAMHWHDKLNACRFAIENVIKS